MKLYIFCVLMPFLLGVFLVFASGLHGGRFTDIGLILMGITPITFLVTGLICIRANWKEIEDQAPAQRAQDQKK
jgi:hypothetical protein